MILVYKKFERNAVWKSECLDFKEFQPFFLKF